MNASFEYQRQLSPTLLPAALRSQVTVFKNLTNIVIVTGDWWFFHQAASTLVIASMAVMVFGALVASYHDLNFR